MEPIISIIMPTYNEEELVVSSLKSLKGQEAVKANPDSFEFVLVDSYSRDRTVELATPYLNNIVLAPIGLLDARTTGILRSKGDIVVAVNADTYYPPTFLGTLLEPFADKEVVAVAGLRVYEGLLGPPSALYELFNMRMFGSGSAFHRRAFEAVGGFDLNIDQFDNDAMVWAEEWDFTDRLRAVGKVIFEYRAVHFTSPRRLLGQLDLDKASFT